MTQKKLNSNRKAFRPYRLLGIDPGTNVLGYAVVEVQAKKKLHIVEMGVVKMSHFDNPYDKLGKIFERLVAIIKHHRPTAMAVEAPFFGKNVQSMLKLGRAQGVAIAAGISQRLEVTEYSPKKIKQSVTGNGNAAKEQVAAMLEMTLQADLSEQYLDATDALAAAVCHFYQTGSALGGRKKYKDWGSFLQDNPDRKG